MIYFFLCFVAPTLVFGLKYTNITTNEENFKPALRNMTIEEKVITYLKNISITTQVPQNSTTTTIIKKIQTKSVPLQNGNKPVQIMKRASLATQKTSKNPVRKKLVKPLRAKKNIAKVEKKRKPIRQDLPDMPLKGDLDEILNSLHKIIDFFLENKNDVDISMYYGLFLLDVSLNKIFKYKQALPSTITFNLKHLLEKNLYLVNFFKKMVELDTDPDDALGKSLVSLFSNEDRWLERVQRFDGAHVNDTVDLDYDVLQSRYSFWDKYLNNVRDYNQAEPSPAQSDKCLGFLARNHITKEPWKKYCQISTGCRVSLERGTDFGYGLTHRLIYLQLAYYSHRCYVFSNNKDKAMREKFCKDMYAEASYISMNEYVEIDLFVEQLCLCALDGHYEFLRRSWLMNILSFQTLAGCFSDKTPEGGMSLRQPEPHEWRLDRGENQYILNGQCNVHTSAAATATLGFAVKFILETFY